MSTTTVTKNTKQVSAKPTNAATKTATVKVPAKQTSQAKQATKQSSSSGTYKLNDTDKFDATKLTFSPIDMGDGKGKDAKFGAKMWVSFPHYDDKRLIVLTDEIKITQYGIPQFGEFVKSDSDRSFVKIPWDPSQPASVKLFKFLSKIDKIALAKKKEFFGASEKLKKLESKYDYVPIVRDAFEPLVEDEKKGAKKDRFKYAKFKLETNFDSGDIETTVFTRDNDEGKPKLVNGIKTVTDLTEYFGWNCKAKFVLSLVKVWFSKSPDRSGKLTYGVGFKLPSIDITERASSGTQKPNFKNYTFGDEDEDEEVVQKSASKTKPKSNKNEDEDVEEDAEVEAGEADAGEEAGEEEAGEEEADEEEAGEEEAGEEEAGEEEAGEEEAGEEEAGEEEAGEEEAGEEAGEEEAGEAEEEVGEEEPQSEEEVEVKPTKSAKGKTQAKESTPPKQPVKTVAKVVAKTPEKKASPPTKQATKPVIQPAAKQATKTAEKPAAPKAKVKK